MLNDVRAGFGGADDVAGQMLNAGSSVTASGTLSGAGITLPAGADAPNSGSFLWSVAPFAADIRCAADIVPSGGGWWWPNAAGRNGRWQTSPWTRCTRVRCSSSSWRRK